MSRRHRTESWKDPTMIVNEWLCNVTFSKRAKMTKIYFTTWILKISRKVCRIGYPYPYAAPAQKQFLDIRIRLKTYYLPDIQPAIRIVIISVKLYSESNPVLSDSSPEIRVLKTSAIAYLLPSNWRTEPKGITDNSDGNTKKWYHWLVFCSAFRRSSRNSAQKLYILNWVNTK